MNQLLAYFRSWWGFGEVTRSMLALQNRISVLMVEKSKSDRQLVEDRKNLTRIQEQFSETVKRQQQNIARAEGLNKKLEEALVSSQEALKTANDIVIPGLVAANQVFISRWEAESQVLAIRQVSRKELE